MIINYDICFFLSLIMVLTKNLALALKVLHNSVPISSLPLILTYLTPASLESLLFLEYTRKTPVSGPLHCTFSSLWHSFSNIPRLLYLLRIFVQMSSAQRHTLTTTFSIVTPTASPCPLSYFTVCHGISHFLTWYILPVYCIFIQIFIINLDIFLSPSLKIEIPWSLSLCFSIPSTAKVPSM